MSDMFRNTGYNSTVFTLDLSNFDTSNVTDMEGMFFCTGYYSTVFTLDVSNFDTSKVTDMSDMFRNTGYNSTKLNTSITISNPNTTSYYDMFYDVATKEGTQITVNYTSKTSSLVDKMIATKTEGANVVKGDCIDCVN
jgi:surface protein